MLKIFAVETDEDIELVKMLFLSTLILWDLKISNLTDITR